MALVTVSYGSVRPIFPFRPRDTVTRIAYKEGGQAAAMVLESVQHPAMPEREGFTRTKILKGLHLVQEVPGKPSLTNFTFTQQVDAGGRVPAWVMNMLIAQDAVGFVERLEKASGQLVGDGNEN